jgi:hypothetical protein
MEKDYNASASDQFQPITDLLTLKDDDDAPMREICKALNEKGLPGIFGSGEALDGQRREAIPSHFT